MGKKNLEQIQKRCTQGKRVPKRARRKFEKRFRTIKRGGWGKKENALAVKKEKIPNSQIGETLTIGLKCTIPGTITGQKDALIARLKKQGTDKFVNTRRLSKGAY